MSVLTRLGQFVRVEGRAVGWGAISVCIAIAVGVRAEYSHYTWWGCTQFLLTAMLAVFDEDHRFAVVFFTQSLLIILGVVVMSFYGCRMLRSVATDLQLTYLPLNFIIHYGLSLAVLLNPPRRPITNYVEQVISGAALFVAYSILATPVEVYGCDIPRGLVTFLFTLFAFLMTHERTEDFFLYYLGGYRSVQAGK